MTKYLKKTNQGAFAATSALYRTVDASAVGMSSESRNETVLLSISKGRNDSVENTFFSVVLRTIFILLAFCTCERSENLLMLQSKWIEKSEQLVFE